MTKEEMIERVNLVKNPLREKETLYSIADELGIKYKRNSCPKCCKDLWNILREQLGLIEDAAELSDFNEKEEEEYVWKYIYPFPVNCGGIVYNQDTDPKYIESFAKANPNKFYVKEYIKNNNNVNNKE